VLSKKKKSSGLESKLASAAAQETASRSRRWRGGRLRHAEVRTRRGETRGGSPLEETDSDSLYTIQNAVHYEWPSESYESFSNRTSIPGVRETQEF
jgi:hypothetical protein